MRCARYAILAIAMLLLFACGKSSRWRTLSGSGGAPVHYSFTIPQVPPMLSGDAAKAYMREHLWDNFDFSDTLQLNRIDRKMMVRAFEIYASTISSAEAYKYISQIMRRASTSKPMFDYFLHLAEFVLNDPNSLERDDEKYIAVLHCALKSDYLDEYEKIPYAYDLRMAQLNRVGHKANDFVYVTADGRESKMWDLTGDYTLMFISNPGCAMCRDIKESIEDSELLSSKIAEGTLRILVVYPDEDLELWRAHLIDYPAAWINGYDKNKSITQEELYNIKAIPSLYLLDSEKRVLAKDCTDVGYIENLIRNQK